MSRYLKINTNINSYDFEILTKIALDIIRYLYRLLTDFVGIRRAAKSKPYTNAAATLP